MRGPSGNYIFLHGGEGALASGYHETSWGFAKIAKEFLAEFYSAGCLEERAYSWRASGSLFLTPCVFETRPSHQALGAIQRGEILSKLRAVVKTVKIETRLFGAKAATHSCRERLDSPVLHRDPTHLHDL